jgi:cytochrome c553
MLFGGLGTIGCSGGSSLPPPDPGTPEDRGRVMYQSYRCVNCHGTDGLGTTVFPGGPRIVGRTAADLKTALTEPCPETRDPATCHPVLMPDMSDTQLSDLATYLLALAGRSDVNPGPVCDDVPGRICTVAGNGVPGNRLVPQIMAREQYLFWPQNVSLDPQGRLVITDWNNYTIRRIENSGCRAITDLDGQSGTDCPIVNLIGTGGLGDSCSTEAAPVQAVDAVMNHPVGLIYDDFIPGQSNILLWGWHQWKVKYIPVDSEGRTGEMLCLFGNGRGTGPDDVAAGFNFDGTGGPTRFNLPSACVYDNTGNFYISDQGNLRIRVVRADADDDNSSVEAFVSSRQNNIVTTFAGGQRDELGQFIRTRADYANSGDGGPVAQCTFNVTLGFDAIPQMRLAIDRPRNLLYVADSENHRIRVIDLSADPPVIDTFAGGGDDLEADGVPATEARLNRPADVDVAVDGSGDVLITDTFNHCVRLVDFDNRVIRTLAGVCGPSENAYEGDGGPATEARLNEPGGSVIAADGTLYIADTINHRVRKVNPVSRGE